MSQVTDPVMLDSTGQIIVSKLQDVIDAINGGTIDPLTVTQNGTYTPSGTTLGYGPVTVDVQGGGGVPLLTRAEWDALTLAQKQEYGLLAIQDANSGFNRGKLVYGADYLPIVPAEMAPIYSWNASNNQINSYSFASATLGLLPTAYCMAIMEQNGNNPAWDVSSNLLPPIATGNQGNGNWAICYGAKAEGDFASTISTGNNWNNSEIVCFCFSSDVVPVVKEVFYEQGKKGTYSYTYTTNDTEKLLLVAMRGGSSGSSHTITGLTQQSHVTASGGRFNDVYYGELTSMGELSISIPYASGNNSNGSLLVALMKVG